MGKRVLILSDTFGHHSDKLGRVLMKNFIYSLARNDTRPTAVMMMNEGVRLACEGSDSVDDLRLLADQGVNIKACGTCLDYLGLADKLAVGEVGTMVGSVEALMAPDEVLTIS